MVKLIYATLSDEELMQCFQEGDTSAFSWIVKRHHGKIYQFIARQVHSKQVAEDLVQDVFVKVIKSADQYEVKSKFCTWFYAIARNTCIDHFRKYSNQKMEKLNEVTSTDCNMSMQGELCPSGENALIQQNLRETLLQAIDLLPDEQKEVFLLREYADLSFKEISELLNISENTIKSRMRYALEKLQIILKEERVSDPLLLQEGISS